MINKVMLLGYMGNTPEIHTFEDGGIIANFSLATSERWKDKEGNKQENTEWHKCVAYRRLAEILQEYCKKGTLLHIEGKLQTRKYTDQNGIDHYPTSIIVTDLKIVKTPNEDERQHCGNTADTSACGGVAHSGSSLKKSKETTKQSDYAKATGASESPSNPDDFNNIPF